MIRKEQVREYLRKSEELKELEKEVKGLKAKLLLELAKSKSNYCHVDVIFRNIADVDKMKEEGIFEEFSKVSEVKKLVVDI